MKEDFLHFLWRSQRIDTSGLRTTGGQTITIQQWGEYNQHGGPDFLNALITIDGTKWAGNVEMHLKSSDWNRHGHQDDERYGNVILHVVLEEDEIIRLPDGSRIPCLELRNRIPPRLVSKYLKLMSLKAWVPCQNHLEGVPAIVKEHLLDRMLIERLEIRTAWMEELLETTGNDWEEAFYRCLMRAMGFHTNGQGMLQLAERLPYKLLLRHRDNREDLEALLFGVSGMLNQVFTDAYPVRLRNKFLHFEHKYKVLPLSVLQWKWMRSRPANFPSIRLSQMAALLQSTKGFLPAILDFQQYRELEAIFSCEAADYWDTHYRFDVEAGNSKKKMGGSSIRKVLINAVLPFLFVYGRERNKPDLIERVIETYAEIPSERNSILARWEELSMPNRHAGHSQALLQLKSTMCDAHHCLSCQIGSYILKVY